MRIPLTFNENKKGFVLLKKFLYVLLFVNCKCELFLQYSLNIKKYHPFEREHFLFISISISKHVCPFVLPAFCCGFLCSVKPWAIILHVNPLSQSLASPEYINTWDRSHHYMIRRSITFMMHIVTEWMRIQVQATDMCACACAQCHKYLYHSGTPSWQRLQLNIEWGFLIYISSYINVFIAGWTQISTNQIFFKFLCDG